MIVLPAIDLKDGKCVRLVQGDFSQQTIVNEDPLQQAKLFKDGGAKYLHIVDLDGALEGRAVNRDLIAQIKETANLPIEVGGGIRSLEQIEDYLKVGIDRVIIGSAALKNPELVKKAVHLYGDKIAVGIDAKNGQVAISGWLDVSSTDFISFAKEMDAIGVKTIIYTDISKDGTLTGPNVDHYKELLSAVNCDIIASGGVSKKEDLVELKEIGVAGAIVGKAYYNGNISMDELREVSEC